MQKDQRIRDPIHNLIKFQHGNDDDHVLWQLLQTSPVQRLRRIRQLGFSDFVYPGATHTRFSHVLGAMQMARRMLSVLERNNFLNAAAEDHKVMRRATLCAALLHDVGHGPYSHVFEEVSRAVGIKIHHEEFTRRIIKSDEISTILENSHKGLTEHVLSFFNKDAGSSAYLRIVSSQLDADRLDFLMRDRHFTGVQFSHLDIEWLLDTISVMEVPIEIDSDAKEFTFVIQDKGLSVGENFLSAYAQMYSKVYLHKTTRAIQFMFRDFLQETYGSQENIKRVPDTDPLKRYFSLAPDPDLRAFLALDDSSVAQALAWARSDGVGKSHELAMRIANRDIYRCFEPPKRPKEDPPRQKLQQFISALKQEDIWFHRESVPEKGYKQFDFQNGDFLHNILVFSKFDGEPKPIVHLSPHVEQFVDRAPIRFYFDNENDREKAKRLWSKI